MSTHSNLLQKSMIAEIMQSADESTSNLTRQEFFQINVASALKPILETLQGLTDDPAAAQGALVLNELIVANKEVNERVYSSKVSTLATKLLSPALQSLHEGDFEHSSGVKQALKQNLEPIVLELEKSQNATTCAAMDLLKACYT